MRYKIVVTNLTDPTDTFTMEGDAVISFIGKQSIEKGEIEHGMGFAGHKRIMAEIISTIPYQIKTLLEEEHKEVVRQNEKHPEDNIVLPKGYEDKKKSTN